MNEGALNSNSVNGSVVRVIAGAAFALLALASSASGFVTQAGAASESSASSGKSTGVRNVLGGGSFVTVVTASAQWSTIASATATGTASGQLVVTNTDAYGIASAGTSSAAAKIVRPGDGYSVATSFGTALPLATIGYASNINVLTAMTAEASVKLSGQSTTQRDGFLLPAVVASKLTPNGLKTAMGVAAPAVTSTASAFSSVFQGGSASFVSVLGLSATGSSDAAFPNGYSSLLATSIVTQYGAAEADTVSITSAAQTVVTQGTLIGQTNGATLMANGRMAQIGGVRLSPTASLSAAGRLAVQASIEFDGAGAITADGTAVILPTAQFTASLTAQAAWVILRDGAANMPVLSSLQASFQLNAAEPAPEERSMYVEADDRTVTVDFDDRTIEVS